MSGLMYLGIILAVLIYLVFIIFEGQIWPKKKEEVPSVESVMNPVIKEIQGELDKCLRLIPPHKMEIGKSGQQWGIKEDENIGWIDPPSILSKEVCNTEDDDIGWIEPLKLRPLYDIWGEPVKSKKKPKKKSKKKSKKSKKKNKI